MIFYTCFIEFIKFIEDTMPNLLWIWNMTKFTLMNVLIQAQAIKCAVWDPTRPRLAICTGNNKIYMWSPQGCISVEVPCEGMLNKTLYDS